MIFSPFGNRRAMFQPVPYNNDILDVLRRQKLNPGRKINFLVYVTLKAGMESGLDFIQ